VPRLCRKAARSQPQASTVPPRSEESPASRRLPRKVESLESLYFTPIPSRTRSRLESSPGSPGDLSLDAGCKTRSARRRTTIDITMTKVSPGCGAGTVTPGTSTGWGVKGWRAALRRRTWGWGFCPSAPLC